MTGTIYSLIPPLIAILMVLLTRRVLLSLGVGIIAAALLISNFSLIGASTIIWNSVRGIFVSDGALNTWNVYILLFLLILGMITAFISISGGSRAFGEWALQSVKTRTGAKLITAFLGVLIFIDDYFNSLTVGQVSRPITDRHRISRAKLAYLIDSTSAPICVISPISSWGAYIIALIGTILATHGVTEFSALSGFIQMIPMNLYVITTLLIVFMVSLYNINIGSMKVHEQRAVKTGEVVDSSKDVPGELTQDLPESKTGSVADLIVPIIALIVGTVAAMIWTGLTATEGEVTIFAIFENTDVSASLLYGGVFGLAVAIVMLLKQVIITKSIGFAVVPKGMIEGIKSMLPAVYILLFAWAIVDLIGQLETGSYLAGIVEQSNMNIAFLPVVMFLIAGVMSFATGTSWGTFGIMLPIAGEIAAATEISLLLPALAAVLAGSVFGDHCSPISDTTILSSTGAGSNHIDHVVTQLPYALISAIISAVGYILLGLTDSTVIALAAVIVMVLIVIFGLKTNKSNVELKNAS